MRRRQGVRATKGFVSTRVSTLPDGTYTDPGQTGLQLRVRSKQDGKATRAWLLRFKFRGEETRIVLGHFPDTTLDDARGLMHCPRKAPLVRTLIPGAHRLAGRLCVRRSPYRRSPSAASTQ